jgi:exodeoxyribonuclease VII small subunit
MSGADGAGPPAVDPASLTFEQLLEALEALTDQMATGALGIEAATDLYEQAAALHTLAVARLQQVEDRIARLAPPTSTT